MSDVTEDTKQRNIPLLDHRDITHFIADIENNFPGYWYSISQRLDSIVLSLGPSLYCTFDIDRILANTPQGDSGLILTYDISKENIDYRVILEEAISRINTMRDDIAANIEAYTIPGYIGKPRKHSKADFKNIKNKYKSLKDTVDKTIENKFVHEIYLGACYLSVDCSIRGYYRDGNPFDHSCDIQSDASLADSIQDSFLEFCET